MTTFAIVESFDVVEQIRSSIVPWVVAIFGYPLGLERAEEALRDRILRHLGQVGGNDPWEGTMLRGPPAT